jgi:hypothetical protein
MKLGSVMDRYSVAPHLLAYGDESTSNYRYDPNVYLMSAVIINLNQESEIRTAAAMLKLKNSQKAHWREDIDKRHDYVIDVISKLNVKSVAIVRHCPPDERMERRRRFCLEQLISQLELADCNHLTLESRGKADDKRDRDWFDAQLASKSFSGFRIKHAAGPAEPLLWLADAVCGAVVEARLGHKRWLDKLNSTTEVKILEIYDG